MYLDKIKQLLITNEGLRLRPYRDTVGKLTIGIGRNLDDVGITEDEAMYLLENDIKRAIQDLQSIFVNFNDYEPHVQAVLVDMIFNLGKPRFLTFKKFIRAIKDGDLQTAAKEMMDSKWARQVKNRAERDRRILLGGENDFF